MNEFGNSDVWTALSFKPRPVFVAWVCIATSTGIAFGLLKGLHTYRKMAEFGFLGYGMACVFYLKYKLEFNSVLVLETNGEVLRVRVDGDWVPVSEIKSVRHVWRRGGFWLRSTFLLANGTEVKGIIRPSWRCHLFGNEKLDYLLMLRSVFEKYGFETDFPS